MYKIIKKPSHVLLLFMGAVDFDSISNAVFELHSNPRYSKMNDVWCFNGCTLNLHYEDLITISRGAKYFRSEEPLNRKTAVVVSKGLDRAFIEILFDRINIQPYEIAIVDNYSAASDWMLEVATIKAAQTLAKHRAQKPPKDISLTSTFCPISI